MTMKKELRMDKLIKYECSKCEGEITLNLKSVVHTKVVHCPFCDPINREAVG